MYNATNVVKYSSARLSQLRVNRYSWWSNWRELADYFLPRRYKWLITPNQSSRGMPLNQHIIDSTGVLAARNLASGLLSGKSSPTRPWFRLRIGRIDSTETSPISLWLAECERLLYLIFQESNFYNSIATFYYDLVIFGTASLLIYEDYDNVIQCFNPCAGEYYVDIDGNYRPTIFYREFTMTIGAIVDRFGLENCSQNIRDAYALPNGGGLAREIIVAHAIEPNNDKRSKDFGLSSDFAFREVYWEYGGSTGQQTQPAATTLLSCKGFFSQPHIICRWDTVSNDAYGRSPAMDAIGDQKQLQLETRRKAQAIDKMVNPPLVADAQLKNSPASTLPGGVTYVNGFTSSGKPGIASIFDTKFPVNEISEDLAEVRERLKKTFFNDLFQTISQFETRSNVSATEIDARKAESLVMLGPVLERIDNEALSPLIERVFDIAVRAGILPPAPQEIQNMPMDIEFSSILAQAQDAASTAGIERLLGLAGNLVGVKPDIMDNIDTDYALDKFSSLMHNPPRMIRSPEAVQAIRQDRVQQVQMQQQVNMAEQLSKGAKNLAATAVGGGQNALEAMIGETPNV